jgi:hypothetical protein
MENALSRARSIDLLRALFKGLRNCETGEFAIVESLLNILATNVFQIHPGRCEVFVAQPFLEFTNTTNIAFQVDSMAQWSTDWRQTFMNPEDRNTSEKEKGQHSRWPKTPFLIALLGASIADHLQATYPQVAVFLFAGLFLLTAFCLLLFCFR